LTCFGKGGSVITLCCNTIGFWRKGRQPHTGGRTGLRGKIEQMWKKKQHRGPSSPQDRCLTDEEMTTEDGQGKNAKELTSSKKGAKRRGKKGSPHQTHRNKKRLCLYAMEGERESGGGTLPDKMGRSKKGCGDREQLQTL